MSVSSAFGAPQQRTASHTKDVPYHCSTVFRAIKDVAAYHSFLRLVSTSTVISKDAQSQPKTVKLKVGYPPAGIEEEWLCHAVFDREAGIAELKSKPDGGVLEQWSLRWKIKPAPSATTTGSRAVKTSSVELIVELKFRSIIYDQMYAILPTNIAEKFMRTFEQRTAELDEEERNERVAKLRAKAKVEAARKATVKAKPATEKKPAPKKLEIRSSKQDAQLEAA